MALIRRMCAEFGVEESDVRGACRLPTAVRVRKIAVYVLRMDRGLTYGEIAKALSIRRDVAARLYTSASKSPDPLAIRFLGAE